MSELKTRREEIEQIAHDEGCKIAKSFKRFVDAWEGKLPANMCDEMTRQMKALLHKQLIAISKAGLMGGDLKRYSRGLHAGAKAGLADLYKPYLEKTT